MVGAVVVLDGRVVAEAHHEEFGGAHAEVLALASGGDVRGATVYASLEPCVHEGKTPPCTDALIAAGVARVVFWAAEPGLREGGGGERLRAAGVQAEGPFGDPADWAGENPFFFHRRRRPFVALKLAVSADGRIAPAAGRRVWLTGPGARREAHRIRAGFDAILVGTGTWKADDPRLTVRGPVTPRILPARVLLDGDGELPAEARALNGRGGPAVVAVSRERAAAVRRRLGDRADVVPLAKAASQAEEGRALHAALREGRLDLAALLAALRERGIERVLCEGGGVLGASLAARRHVDRIYLFLAPQAVGPAGVPAFPADDAADLPATELAEYLLGLAARTGSEPHPAPAGWRIAAGPDRLGADSLVVLDKKD